jgi:hypothetical protein
MSETDLKGCFHRELKIVRHCFEYLSASLMQSRPIFSQYANRTTKSPSLYLPAVSV